MALLLLVGAWYGIWSYLVSADVARVKATLEHHNQGFKAANPYMELRADKVAASGFPFSFRVKVTKPTLSMIWQKQTFAASIPFIELSEVSSSDGRYRVTAPLMMDALFTTDGEAPEQYHVTFSALPKILLRAQGSSALCPNMPGMRQCPPVDAVAPLISFAADLPEEMRMTIDLAGKSKEVKFNFHSMGVPLFFDIPRDGSGLLEIFVGMLREAMIYQK